MIRSRTIFIPLASVGYNQGIMTKYVALLRGIGPGNPNMRNDKLRGLFEDLGFKNVQSVISSGNILFESDGADIGAMERQAESAFPEKLEFNCTTIIRSQEQLQALIDLNPYEGYVHGPGSYLLTTFFKSPRKIPFEIPYQPEGKPYRFIGATDTAIFSTTDNTIITTSDLMTWLEKQFGKDITSRTWKTVERILVKLNA